MSITIELRVRPTAARYAYYEGSAITRDFEVRVPVDALKYGANDVKAMLAGWAHAAISLDPTDVDTLLETASVELPKLEAERKAREAERQAEKAAAEREAQVDAFKALTSDGEPDAAEEVA